MDECCDGRRCSRSRSAGHEVRLGAAWRVLRIFCGGGLFGGGSRRVGACCGGVAGGGCGCAFGVGWGGVGGWSGWSGWGWWTFAVVGGLRMLWCVRSDAGWVWRMLVYAAGGVAAGAAVAGWAFGSLRWVVGFLGGRGVWIGLVVDLVVSDEARSDCGCVPADGLYGWVWRSWCATAAGGHRDLEAAVMAHPGLTKRQQRRRRHARRKQRKLRYR